MPSPTAARAVVALFAASALVIVTPPRSSAAAPAAVSYRPPVDAPISLPFRAPATPYGRGHRGIEYDTPPGTAVAAAADGDVVFAGAVASHQWVTLLHGDGVRTTYGPMATVAVNIGEHVTQATTLGTTEGRLLFTARVDGDYIDPATLIDGAGAGHVRLVPVPAPGDMFGPSATSRAVDAVATAAEWLGEHEPQQVLPTLAAAPIDFAHRVVVDLERARERRAHCTPADVDPSAPTRRRVAVLVGGLGSSSEHAAIDGVPTDALGYDPATVVRFSYAGGVVPEVGVDGVFSAIPANGYASDATFGDLETAAGRLADLIVAVAAGVDSTAVVDVFGHSEGGVITVMALRRLASDHPDALQRIGTVVVLGAPVGGAPLASFFGDVADDPLGGPVLSGIRTATRASIDPASPAVHQLEVGAPALAGLAAPTAPRVVSIAARGDLVVPPPRAELAGATNVVVPVEGVDAHDALPASAVAEREMALALAGLPPGCESWSDIAADIVVGDGIDSVESTLAGLAG